LESADEFTLPQRAACLDVLSGARAVHLTALERRRDAIADVL
jgi:hypothetical protein